MRSHHKISVRNILQIPSFYDKLLNSIEKFITLLQFSYI